MSILVQNALGKHLKIVLVDLGLIVPYEFPSFVENSYEIFHLNMYFLRFSFLFALSIKKLNCVQKHIASLLVGNGVVIVHFYKSQYLFWKISHYMTRYNWAVEELNKEFFAIVGLEEVFLTFLNDPLSVNDL